MIRASDAIASEATFPRATAPAATFGSRSTWIRRGDVRWQVQIAGSGPPLLLVHGTGASSHSFRELTPLLANRFTVIAPDMPGHGGSEAAVSFIPTLPAFASSLADLCNALSVSPSVAVGHSAGAAVIARMTLDRLIRPDLLVGLGAALIPLHGLPRAVFPTAARVLAQASKLVPFRIGESASVDRVLRSTGSSLDDGGVDLYRRLWSQPSHVAAVLAMMAHWDIDPLFADLQRLDTRFLLVTGKGDRAVRPIQQHEIAARLPRSRVVEVEGAGHLVHEEKPTVVARLIIEEVDAAARDVVP